MSSDPRWGTARRDRKAEAILGTLRRVCGDAITAGCWVDIGCGSGGIADALAPHVDRIIGVDPEPWDRWAEMQIRHPNLEFVVATCDSDALPIAPGSADVVVCNQVYEHVADPQRLIGNLYRLLKPTGVCYFAGPNLLWPIEPHVNWPFVHWLPRRLAHGVMRALHSRRVRELDAYSADYWRLTRWFRDSGFEFSPAIAARLEDSLVAHGRRPTLPRVVARTVDSLSPIAPGFIFVLRKPDVTWS